MKVYHITPRRNKESVMLHGLRADLALDGPPRVYLCHRADVEGMVRTVRQRHECADVCILYVDIGSRIYRRENAVSFYLERDVAPHKILGELALEGV